MLNVISISSFITKYPKETPIKREAIFISNNYKDAEKEYIKTQTTYAALSKKYGIPLAKLSFYAKENKWVEKRKKRKPTKKKVGLDVTKLSNSQEDLEKIIESAFSDAASKTLEGGEVDVKYLKDLTSTLKEAVNIKRNIFATRIKRK